MAPKREADDYELSVLETRTRKYRRVENKTLIAYHKFQHRPTGRAISTPNNAADKVFKTYELVEHILSYLAPTDTGPQNFKSCNKLTRFVREVLLDSSVLQKMVYVHLPADQQVVWGWLPKSRKWGSLPGPLTIPRALHATKSGHVVFVCSVVLNQNVLENTLGELDLPLERLRQSISTRNSTQLEDYGNMLMHRLRKKTSLHVIAFKIDPLRGQYQDTFLTTPPVTEITFCIENPQDRLAVKTNSNGYSHFPRSRVARAEGVRVRDIMAEMQQLGPEWVAKLRHGRLQEHPLEGIVIPNDRIKVVRQEMWDFVMNMGKARFPAEV
ncbi:hypothetical protein Slin15195_G041570 [Septoria linicola]|uniref:Uncharacterized protein n=1 Tax=Septoria linicola TaxID=215465 RepID=A0A9Q9EIZ4_9PEZI|nr:hypothetical protein Slin14017_G045090 [Septoria linicola]USW50838.1 hypothetical protein Slin15195_G041570 [Septoria linicola]